MNPSEKDSLLDSGKECDASEETWKRIAIFLNNNQLDKAKVLCQKEPNSRNKKALLAYIQAEEVHNEDALAMLEEFSTPPASQEVDNLQTLLINTQLAVLCVALASQTFGELSKCYLQTAEVYTSKINHDQAKKKLPIIQSLKLQRISATLLINAGESRKSLEMLNRISITWEKIAEGSKKFHPDIQIILDLIKQASRMQEQPMLAPFNDRNLAERMLQNSTVSLDINEYIKSAAKTRKDESLHKHWQAIAETCAASGVNSIITNSENAISKRMLERLSLKKLDKLELIKEDSNGEMRIPIIVEKKITIKGSFVIKDNAPTDLLISKCCLCQITKN